MKLSKQQIRIMIESIIKELNFNTDAELFRKMTPSQPGYADSVISQRQGLASSYKEGEYYEDPNMLYEEDSEEDPNLDEFSSVGGAGGMGGSIQGYTKPLFGKQKKAKKTKKK